MLPTIQTFFLSTSSLLILSLINFFPACIATTNCPPSSCGIIPYITFPFRLKNDPTNCGDRSFELACENNITFLYLNSQKYYVKAINYNNNTIRLVDASIENEICSFPNHSTYYYNFTDGYPYRYSSGVASPINLMTCPYPLKDSSQFTAITDCASDSNSNSSSYPSRYEYEYIKIGSMNSSEVPRSCGIDLIVITSWQFGDLSNVSISEIHESLLYGFEVFACTYFWCRRTTTNWAKITNFLLGTNGLLLIPLAILVFIVAGVSLPVTIIIGLTGVSVISFSSFGEYWPDSLTYSLFPNGVNLGSNFTLAALLLLLSFATVVCLTAALSILTTIIVGFVGALVISFLLLLNWPYGLGAFVESKTLYTGLISSMVIFVPRFIMFPFVVWFLIYKFRRRRLSTFDSIESYLQSDNKLVPIRYTYSDLKQMTKGFKDKLGEGGYGCVYKGKLRSGHHVAVKLLGKSGGNGQDFMNEIATIGRIHHVNVVKLVGYCAQGSKRALIYDFMSNGSLEKYLFGREKTSSLNWDTKFEIVVGAARGIEYLHRGCDVQILHFDIKPHNILLDENFVPKISDFGLAKFYSTGKNAVTMTAARGTIGYVAPELINRNIGVVSYKADVYSFGMLLMEIVGLNRDLEKINGNSDQYFPNWIYDSFDQGKDIIEIVKGYKNEDEESIKNVGRKMTIVALWCIQMNPDDRPSMNKVLEMLEGDVERLLIPDYPSQSAQIAVNVDHSEFTYSSSSLPMLHFDGVSSSVEINVQEL